MHVPGLLALSAVLAAPAFTQPRPKFLDVMTVQLKPDKHAEFHALMRKAVDANRRNNGDHWITWAPVYGTGGTVQFTSPRLNYADVEKSYQDFDRALKESLGPAMEKLGYDFDSCIESSRSELRLFRWDLSRNVPDDIEALHRMVGNARWVRTTRVEVKRDRVTDFENRLPEFLDALHKNLPEHMTMVSQTSTGSSGDGVPFYFTNFYSSMAEMDKLLPMKEMLGEELYAKFGQMNGEDVLRVATEIARPMPQLSNPPEDIVKVSQDFWMPRPTATAARRAKPSPQSPKETH